jgi:hypothetical protein
MHSKFARKMAFAAMLISGCVFGSSQAHAQFDLNKVVANEAIPAKAVRQVAFGQSVYVGSDARISGQVNILGSSMVRAAGALKLTFSSSDGETRETVTDSQGNFVVDGAKPGVYSIYGKSGNVVVCQSIRVFASPDASASGVGLYAVSPTSAPMDKILTTAIEPVSTMIDESNLPGPPANYASTEGRVSMDAQGMVHGNLWSVIGDVKNSTVTIFQNGMEVGKTVADEKGKFSVRLNPGTYSLLASGTGGVAAVGFKVVNDGATAFNKAFNSTKFVSLRTEMAAEFVDVGCGICPTYGETIVDQPVEIVDAGTPYAGGGYAGGYGSMGGGGGGAAGGPGAGRLLSIAGLGAGIAGLAVALGDNEDAPVVSAAGQ